ncbi:MAG: N-acetylmuramoyl-L-alanine amidase [Flavobacteriaceae bacterium]|nr:N-acetylmuramoyl-L-alanine amidase [Flavobacteriaceae bacterium]
MFLFAVVLFFAGQSYDSQAQKKIFTLVLDAGHGGYEPGNIGNGYREKNISLKVVLAIGRELEKNKSIHVIYTRKKDVFVDLWKRGEIANKAKADLFVSVHCNAHNSNASGTESFVLGLKSSKKNFEIAKKENAVILLEKDYKKRYKGFDPNSPESVIGISLIQEENLDKSLFLAAGIQKNFRRSLKKKDRGVKQANFVVLHQTYMPSVLVELGFLTNKNEGRYLNSKKGQQEMAKAISKAIEKYVDQLQLNTIDVVLEDTVVDDTPMVIDEVTVEEKKEPFFKIQIASSKKKIKTKSYNFKGLKNVERVKVGRYYKYYYGNTSDYKEVKSSLKRAKKKGYSSAFIAAFKNGEKISLKEALN